MQSYTKIRREKERDLRRRAILNSALKLFAQMGYENTTVEMIAVKSQLSKGLVYFYFQSKDHILSEIIKEFYTPFLTRLCKILQGYESPLEKFKAFIKTELEFYARNPDLAKVLFSAMTPHQMKRLKSEYQQTFAEIHKKEGEILDLILNEGIEKGIFKDIQLGLLRIFITGPVHELVQPNKITLLKNPSTVHQIVELYIKGVIKEGSES